MLSSVFYCSPELGTAAVRGGRGRTRQPSDVNRATMCQNDAQGKESEVGVKIEGGESPELAGDRILPTAERRRHELESEQPGGSFARVFEGKGGGGRGVYIDMNERN